MAPFFTGKQSKKQYLCLTRMTPIFSEEGISTALDVTSIKFKNKDLGTKIQDTLLYW
ncbi:hypothetical protein [Muricauda sp. NFXS6]|uniref:hypothetical protein n=1 Tax=Allomuricauda sp. NFXS6 TaxID=2819094 RepID=UPI0032DFAD79